MAKRKSVKLRRIETLRTIPPGKGARTGSKTLFGRIQAMMDEKDGNGEIIRDACANAYVNAMKNGSFVHAKEMFDREEGKVPTRLANADGENMKMYIGMPTEGDNAP